MKKYLSISIIIFLFNVTLTLYAQWQQCSGIYGGYFTTLVVNGDKIYVGSGNYGGIYVSTDNGSNWTAIGPSGPNGTLDGNYIRAIAIINNTIIAGSSFGICTSTNNGINWTHNSSLTQSVYTLVILGSNIFAGTYNGLYFSTDNGDNWTQTSIGSLWVESLANKNGKLIAGTSKGMFSSTDNGSTWYSTGFEHFAIISITISGNNIYIAANEKSTSVYGIYMSSDDGISWFNIYSTDSNIYSVFASGNNLFTCTGSSSPLTTASYLTTNNGLNWTQLTGLNNQNAQVFIVNGNKIFAGSWGCGIFSSTDNGSSWAQTGVINRNIIAFTKCGGNLFTGCSGSGVYASTNEGINWHHSELSNNSIISLAQDSSYIYAGTNGTNGLFVSSNSGINWYKSGMPNNYRVNDLAAKGNYVFAATYYVPSPHGNYLFISSNNGASWFISPANFTATSFVIKGDTVFAGSKTGVYYTTNNGNNWIQTGLNSSTSFLVLDGNKLYAAGSNIYVTENYGINWSLLYSSNPGFNITSFAVSGIYIFKVESTYHSIEMSSNNGLNWAAVNEGFPSPLNDFYIINLFTDNNYIFTGTSAGAWRRPLSDFVSVNNISGQLPQKYNLSQNYPNPFNPSTTIKYDIPKEGMVSLKVFDILGREVYSSNEYKKAGSYEFTFDGSNLASGLYFYKIITDNYNETKKMILIK